MARIIAADGRADGRAQQTVALHILAAYREVQAALMVSGIHDSVAWALSRASDRLAVAYSAETSEKIGAALADAQTVAP